MQLCASKRRTFRYLTPLSKRIVITHADCVCNERMALTNRHQVENSGFSIPVIERLSFYLKERVKFRLEPSSVSEVLSHYSGSKRKLFATAAESLLHQPLCKADGHLKMFIKDDKYFDFPAEVMRDTKAPRAIQYRNKRYGVSVARFIQPFEHELLSLQDWTGSSVIAKTRNSHQRASDLWVKWNSFPEPAAILLDHSKFDAHVNMHLLRVEHDSYLRAFDSNKKLQVLLKMQRHNFGRTKSGLRYYTPGTRMSGDQNTACGNCLLNFAMLELWLKDSKVIGSVYVDGDDSVIVVNSDSINLLLPFEPYFKQFGIETRYCEKVYSFSDVDFCQSKPVFDGFTWRMVRNPLRVLYRGGVSTKPIAVKFLPRFVKSLGLCELSLSDGLPVLQAYALRLIEIGSGEYWPGHELHYRAKLETFSILHARARPISYESRISFAAAFGISIEQQLSLERRVRKMKIESPDQSNEAWEAMLTDKLTL